MASKTLTLLGVLIIGIEAEVCPIQCDCDLQDGLKRAMCVNQNIISIDIGVPSYVQVYDLHNNAISELENFCFASLGYTSLQFIDLSYNRIFWIGLHAFSGATRLLHLDLSNNRLRAIAADLLWDAPLLEHLDLSGNVFETLKNEPFLMHTNLKVLNLSNCRITALPLRMFTRLPNLRKLDLSDNYMISLQIPVLAPLRRLERLELRNEYWKCIPEFLAAESWIVGRNIDYEKQCKDTIPKMSEKMISLGSPEVREAIDINIAWNMTVGGSANVTLGENKPKERRTFFQRFEQEFPSLWALLVGFEVGLVLGVAGTYFWLRKVCDCGALRCARPQTPRQRRRQRRVEDGELRANLLWSAVHADTPPPQRRRPELPEGAAACAAAARGVAAARGAVAARDESGGEEERAETPPPPYVECSHRLWV